MNDSQEPPEFDIHPVPDGDLVLTIPGKLSDEQLSNLRVELAVTLPGRNVLILQGGVRLEEVGVSARLEAIEGKLDTLLAWATEADEEAVDVTTLEGRTFVARDPKQGLG